MKLTANKIFIIMLLMFTKVDIFCVQYYHEESRNPSDYSNLYKHSVLPSTFHSCIKTAVINAKNPNDHVQGTSTTTKAYCKVLKQ